jgi:hypothetical protein
VRLPARSLRRGLGGILGGAVLVTALAACGNLGGTASAPVTASLPDGSQDAFGAELAQALVEKLLSDPFVAHVDQVAKATSTSGGTTVEINATLAVDLSGNDTSFSVTVVGGGQDLQADMVLLGDSAFGRQGVGAWEAIDPSSVRASVDGLFEAMRLVENPADLAYRGIEAIDGRDLHRLTAVTVIPYRPAGGGSGQYDRFDLWVEADGTPVLFKSAFSAVGPAGEVVSGETDLTFSSFGGPIEIVAPVVGP